MSLPPVVKIAVQRVDLPGRWVAILLKQVTYAFVGSAPGRRVIDASWIGEIHVSPRLVYVRTVEGALFRTGFASLKAFDGWLRRKEILSFLPLHRLVRVQVDNVVELDLGGNLDRVGVRASAAIEYLAISRRRRGAVRELFGLPRRVSRGSWRPAGVSTARAPAGTARQRSD